MSKSSDMSTSNQHVKYYIEVVEGTQNIANNTSPVTVRVWFYRTNSYSTYGTGTVYCKIDGTQYSSSVTPSQAITSTPICLFEKTVTITHASNGSKTLKTSAWISHNAPLTSSEQSYSVALSTIPRASSISSVTSPVSVNGSNKITISISRKSSSFTHTVKIKFGSYSQTISGVATSTSYTIPVSWLDAIPNSDSGTGTITVQTKSGSTNIGSAVSKSFTVTVPADYIPTFTSVTATPKNSGAIASWDAYIQGKSRCQLVISGASANHGATVKSYSITGGGFSTNISNYTTSALPNSGDIVFEAKVIDSRGRSSVPQTVTIHVEPYEPPSFENLSTYRCTPEGVEDGHGSRVRCFADFVFSPCGGLNSATAKVYYRRSGTTDRSGEMTLQNGVALILGNTSYGEISEDYSWDIVYEISDALNTSTTVVVIHTSFNTMDFKCGGKGVAFGKASEKENTVEISSDWKLETPELYIGGHKVGTYVIESDTVGIWSYKKWNDGWAELWGDYTTDVIASTGRNGSAYSYYSEPVTTTDFPFELIQGSVKTFYSTQNAEVWYSAYSDSTLTTNVQFRVNTTEPLTRAFTPHIRVIGRFGYPDDIANPDDVLLPDGAPEMSYYTQQKVVDLIYPVGAIYMSVNSASPNNLFPGTIWTEWGVGRVPIGVDALDEDYSEAEKTGGAKTVNLSHRHVQSVGVDGNNVYLKRNNGGDSTVKKVDRTLASHTSHATDTGRFGYTDNAGSTTQSIVQPYITCYMWKRTS